MRNAESRPKVVLVDDDKFWASTVIRELEKIFDVVYLQEAGEVLPYFEDNYDTDGIILDIMMDPPDGVAGEAEDGQFTGVWILRQLVSLVKTANIPVVVLSNHHDIKEVERRIGELGEIVGHVTVHEKYGKSRTEIPPFLMARIRAVKGMA